MATGQDPKLTGLAAGWGGWGWWGVVMHARVGAEESRARGEGILSDTCCRVLVSRPV